MTPEKEIVEAAVEWRKAWHELQAAEHAKKEFANCRPFSNCEFSDASNTARLKLDIANALTTQLRDLLDEYIGETK